MSHSNNEAAKLEQHLILLRDQYSLLQEKYEKVVQERDILVATSGASGQPSTYTSRLLSYVSELYNKNEYSDLEVKVSASKSLRAHKFVLQSRSEHWSNLLSNETLDWSDLGDGVGETVLQWVYSGALDTQSQTDFMMLLMRASAKLSLPHLLIRCEEIMVGRASVKNCVRLYTTADEIGASILKQHCSTLISNHWDDFTSADFSHMSGPLLASMIKEKTSLPLHAAVRHQREDVIFLYLIEFRQQLPTMLENRDSSGSVVLEVALLSGQKSVADTLVQNGASIDAVDAMGATLLLRAVKRADEFSVTYLLNHEASVNHQEKTSGKTALHVLAAGEGGDIPDSSRSSPLLNGRSSAPLSPSGSEESSSSFTSRQRTLLCKLLLQKGADPNMQDSSKRTVFHISVCNLDIALVTMLLEHHPLQLELRDSEGRTVLWYALFLGSDSKQMAEMLVTKGADVNASAGDKSGDSLLHYAAKNGPEWTGLFLVNHQANVKTPNRAGETPLHCSATRGCPNLTRALLEGGSNPNAQTVVCLDSSHRKTVKTSKDTSDCSSTSSSFNPFEEEVSSSSDVCRVDVYKETPLHRALDGGNVEDVEVILQSGKGLKLELRDSHDVTALGLSLHLSLLKSSASLLTAGADISALNAQGSSYLHTAVHSRDVQAATFLLGAGIDPNLRNREGVTALELCIHGGVQDVPLLQQLCQSAASCPQLGKQRVLGLEAETPLWQSLVADRRDVAAMLVKYGVDPNSWHEGADNYEQTLLHRAIDENLEDAAIFLIDSGCDINSPRRPLGSSSEDLLTPLHMCSSWGLDRTSFALAQRGAKLNAKDCDGKTPLHHAIENGHPLVTEMLLQQAGLDISIRDKCGTTPFAAAMTRKNNAAAKAILDRDPKAAQQFDHKGHNFLHVAVSKGDLESVLFLLSIHVDLSTRTNDEKQLSPLHLATISGSELLVRNLLLAGSEVNALTPHKQTVLHLAAQHDHSHLITVLLENAVNYDAIDADLNNALHIAVKCGHVATCRVLLTESTINAVAVNMRGQNPLHLLATFSPPSAPAIAKLFVEAMPDYPLNTPDVHGNTALLLSYQRGGSQLCRVLVSSGANMGSPNHQGETLFNSAVASRALLGSLLDSLSSEPSWAEADNCMECAVKFTIATRRHHCRHCGRVLCSKCSDKLLPILKFGLQKPVRVCDICSQVLTLGPAALS